MTPPRQATRRRILKGLGFIVYNLVAATILLEAIIVLMLHVPRVVGASPRPLRRLIQQVYRHFNRSLIQFDARCARYDPGLAYTLRPGTCTFENIEFKNVYRINSVGVRDEGERLPIRRIEPDVFVRQINPAFVLHRNHAAKLAAPREPRERLRMLPGGGD